LNKIENKVNKISNAEELKERLCGYGLIILNKIESTFSSFLKSKEEMRRFIYHEGAYYIMITLITMSFIAAVFSGCILSLLFLSKNIMEAMITPDTIISNATSGQCLNILWPQV